MRTKAANLIAFGVVWAFLLLMLYANAIGFQSGYYAAILCATYGFCS